MKKKIFAVVAAALLIVVLIVFSNPVRAIKICAVLYGCDVTDVMHAEVEKCDTISRFTSEYKAVNTVLPDKLTGSGHQSWYVFSVLFLKIPIWAGNG